MKIIHQLILSCRSINICKVDLFAKRKMLRRNKNIVFIALLLLFSQVGFSQGSEEELKEQAAEMFEDGKLVEAAPLYGQLLSLYPKDPNYNYRYGACLLASDSDKNKPLKYLQFAIQSGKAEPLAHYYLGKAYHLNYNFAKAVKQYSRFKTKGSADQRSKYQVERQIEMCKNGNKLLSKLNEVQVLSRQEISKKDFFRIYELDGINGKIIAKPADFKSKYDLKIDEKSVIYLPNNAKEVYYSSYGKKGEQGKDIFKSIKLGNGSWSEPANVGPAINTKYDEDYPFIHPDGRTLYFASKGHTSMGGYDLFVSTFDNSINDWSTPINLDFAFSSADDDILFVTDEDKAMAYFASSRSNPNGKINVYKVQVKKEPVQLSVIAGKFIAESNTSLKKAKITVIDQKTNNTIGVYETDANGNYKIEINQNGGEYQFNIETTENDPIHTGVVNIPEQEEFALLGQELRLVGEGGDQQLVIKNIFDGSTNASNTAGPLVSSDILRKKAQLDVNVSAEELAALLNPGQNTNDLANNTENNSNSNQTGPVNSSNTKPGTLDQNSNASSNPSSTTENAGNNAEQVSIRLNQTEKDVLAKNTADKNAVNYAYSDAIRLKAEADDLFTKADQTAQEDVKQGTLDEAKRTALLAAYATQFAKEVEKEEKRSADQVEKITSAKTQLENGNAAAAEIQLEKVQSEKAKNRTTEEVIEDLKSKIQKDLLSNAELAAELDKKKKSFQSEKEQLVSQITVLKDEMQKGSASKKAELQKQIEGYELDLADMDFQLSATGKEYDQAIALEENKVVQLEQVETFEGFWQSEGKLASNAAVSDGDRNNLVQSIQSFRDNDQLAFNESNSNSASSDLNGNSSSLTNNESNSGNQEAVNNTSSFEQKNQRFQNELNQANNISDVDLKGAKKVQVYANWLSEIEGNIVEQENALVAETNPETRTSLQNDLDLMLDKKNSLQTAFDQEQNAIANNASTNPLASNSGDLTSSPSNTNTNSAINNGSNVGSPALNQNNISLDQIDVSQVDENSIIPDQYTSLDFQQEFVYANTSSKPDLVKAKQALAEAAVYSQKATDTRRAAYQLPTVEERNRAFEEASAYDKASEERQINAAEIYGSANANEYGRNASLLSSSENYGENFESSNLDIANLLVDEAEVYYNKGLEERQTIDPQARLSVREVQYQKAYDFEMLALTKQKEALKLLAIVDDEYQANPVGKVFSVSDLSSGSKSGSTAGSTSSSIKDAEVLAVTQPEIANQKADSLNAIVVGLEEQLVDFQDRIDASSSQAEKEALTVERNDIQTEIDRIQKKASIFTLRAEELSSSSSSNEVASKSILKPAAIEFSKQVVELDTVEISDERKALVLNSSNYSNYLNEANKRARAIKAANEIYQTANQLEDERVRLVKEAQVARSQVNATAEGEEKQRLIKSAEVLDLKVAKTETSLDSLNTIIKVNNFLISSSEQKLNNILANLDELEKQEIIQLAQSNINAEALPADNIASQETPANNELAQNELSSTETSQAGQQLPELDPISTTNPAENLNASDNNSNTIENNSNEGSTTKPVEALPVERKDPELIRNTIPQSITEIDRIPKTVNKAIYMKVARNESVYSNAKPIPVDPKMPEGLVYKVQVGAFRNPIPQDLFKGFAPLMAEKVPSGITRYTAGIFVNEREAVFARDEIRSFGYQDAFVVAFFNGKRISITQARTQGGGNDQNITFNTEKSPSAFSNTVNQTPVKEVVGGSKEQLPSSFNGSDVASVVNVATISGVYYTVQIGVYSKPVPNGEFDQFSDLNVLVLPNGLIRYNAGIFQSASEAIELKESTIGDISDAFVTAYYKGKRISLSQAARIQNQ